MRLLACVIFSLGLISVKVYSQTTMVIGRVVDVNSGEAIVGAEARLLTVNIFSETDLEGRFNISAENLPLGEQVLMISANGYLSKKFRVIIEKGQVVNIDPLHLETDIALTSAQIGLISLSDYELDQDEDTTSNFSGLLQATNDVFLNAAAYDFSATFFKPRGFDNSYSKLLINGIEMNKLQDGRPQWANWGGLNDVQRNREFTMGSKANENNFGGIAGTTHMIMRASKYRRGGRISYAMANRSYEGRIMGSFSSGHSYKGWSYTILASRRFGERGFIEGTPYLANSFFLAVERKLNDAHHVNFAAFYTPLHRGRSTALTEEVENLKGRTYNPNWGFQDGQIRSSRIRRVEEPIAMLNYFWNISEGHKVNINAAFQFGEIGNTRLEYSGNRNPSGNYYQRLPSYFLRFENPSAYDFQLSYDAEKEFINNGQLDWQSFYRANSNTSTGNSIYTIQEDITKDNQLTFNIISRTPLSDHIILNGKLEYRSLISENFARLKDLLGGNGYLDVDYFGDDPLQTQNDVQNPDRIVLKDERYKYNYQLMATQISGFVQAQLRFRNMEIYVAGQAAQSKYQRKGLYQNGYFREENRSLGKSEAINFINFNAKAGATYTITGRHLIDLNLAYLSKPPSLRNSFANVRQNNDLIKDLTTEKIQLADLSYLYRSSLIKARLSAFYANFFDQTEIGFYFTQNALGSEDNNAFVQEIVTGIGKRNIGLELGLEAQILPTFKLKVAASAGQYTYVNNPNLYLSGDDFDSDPSDEVIDGNDLITLGKRQVFLKNYHVSGGPERAYQLGIEYRDPKFWWVGTTVNYFSNAYIDISLLRRTSDFYSDIDGLPFNNYNEETASNLLQQEEFPDYFLVNIIAGKSWRIKRYFVGFFASINNVLDTEYRTGGFEDSRRVSYRQRLEEENREYGPLFGNRYFFGNGTTYYLNLYIRF